MAAPFFPSPLPGEIDFSILGRYHSLGAGAFSADDRAEITGTDVPALLQPAGPHALPVARYIAKRLGQSLDTVLSHHTVLPYFRPFVETPGTPLARIPEELSALRKIKWSPRLRSCPLCVRDAVNNQGMPYWLRQHQLPLVTACAIHKIKLIESFETTSAPHTAKLPLPEMASPVLADESASQTEIRFASECTKLLTHHTQAAGIQALRETWRATLFQHRMNIGSEWDFATLEQKYRHSLGDDFINHIAAAEATNLHGTPWFLGFVGSPSKLHHPVQHVLFGMVFFGGIGEFLGQVNAIKAKL